MKIAVIGTGLIGGSMALTLKKAGYAGEVIGVENNEAHGREALKLGIVDRIENPDVAISQSDIIIIAVPVNIASQMVGSILEKIDRQVLIDVGSTKQNICEEAAKFPNRGRFVAAHPMWGTEYSGPQAAVADGFQDNAVIICEPVLSDKDALTEAEKIFSILGMRIYFMDAAAHDLHAAYVSHISHITSFALANTVLEKEKEEAAIFQMASAGFESTVRLAKSNPKMWTPIFIQNRENVLDVLNEHISQLKKFKSCLEKENYEYLNALIEGSNNIKKILK